MTSKKNNNKKCPICNGPVEEKDHGLNVEIVCYNCNVVPIIVGFYKKKRDTDEK